MAKTNIEKYQHQIDSIEAKKVDLKIQMEWLDKEIETFEKLIIDEKYKKFNKFVNQVNGSLIRINYECGENKEYSTSVSIKVSDVKKTKDCNGECIVYGKCVLLTYKDNELVTATIDKECSYAFVDGWNDPMNGYFNFENVQYITVEELTDALQKTTTINFKN